MKLELRRIAYSPRLSQETAAYAADIWVDGVKRGSVSNEGHGGADMIQPHSLQVEIDAYAKTLPPTVYEDVTLLHTAESLFAKLLDRHLAEKRLKRMMAKKTVIARDGKIYVASPSYAPKAGERVLNRMPLDEAVTTLLASA